MLRLSKKIEYALAALSYMAKKKDCFANVKELSENLKINFDFMSKVLQKLQKAGIVSSKQGSKGGYALKKNPSEISVKNVIDAIEPSPYIAACFDDEAEKCDREYYCEIRDDMYNLQLKIYKAFEETKISDFAHKKQSQPTEEK